MKRPCAGSGHPARMPRVAPCMVGVTSAWPNLSPFGFFFVLIEHSVRQVREVRLLSNLANTVI